ncbi:hypothetical protein DUF421 [Gottschalkia acidurici 9a]|uniref:DUF421 domain-containing protein n=1 Tax=Gottschalkia acidurici (strain ATCC 7906 / DSM 604 / BCRC 14475 / CIP 104303 / KCTC 5404 / NCIMB 10678 / 9a) TaxID=1128398 RepID=K0B3R2_GOTA9|nr:DUF421 domain-containing protein [Gottschalkia acidurici]AFS79782.1 hypothetical protein DUF421 [Gottschalkia acidurici 9a]
MDFLHGQETLTSIEWALRAIIAFFFLLTVAKLLGQRAISQLRLLDFVIAIVIGNIIAHPLSDERLGLKGSIITTLVLVTLYFVGIFSTFKFPLIRKLISNSSITIVQNGEILYDKLKKARISIDVLLEELREKKVDDVTKVALATWEPDGKISVFLHPKYNPITPSSLHIETEPYTFPRTIVKEGKVNLEELKKFDKTEDWIVSKLKFLYQTEVKNVLLATLDNKDNLKIFLYN